MPVVFVSVTKSCLNLCNPMDCSTQDPLSSIVSQSLLKSMSRESVMPYNHLSLCHPPLLLPSIFPIKVFFSELSLHIKWSKYWSFTSTSVLPMNIQDWLPLGLTGLISIQSMGFSTVFSSTTVQKHQFFGAQPSLWSNTHIHIWLLGKPKLWLYRPLSTKWCLCFLIHFLGLS